MTLHTMPALDGGTPGQNFIPYAKQRWEPGASGPVAICPVCDIEIPLVKRKDFESFTGNEYLAHYAAAAAAEAFDIPIDEVRP